MAKMQSLFGGEGKWESYLFFGYRAFTNRNGDSWSGIRMETSQMVLKEGMWPLVCGFLFSDANIFLTIKIFKEMHIVIITLYHNHTKRTEGGQDSGKL